ncbi:hypothetical protein Pcac1_g22443 [Phytophthora cactorum]|nr:hypothetical protein Pcac1_g22443 [Phytophthora cactorum]
MRAHISKEVKAKCAARNVSMCVIPGADAVPASGRHRHLQDVQGLLYMERSNAWKESDKVEYTRFSNPRMSSVDGSKKAWRDTDCETVANSVAAAGFADHCMDWYVARHDDVYGDRFRERQRREARGIGTASRRTRVEFNLDELHDTLDDIALIDE